MYTKKIIQHSYKQRTNVHRNRNQTFVFSSCVRPFRIYLEATREFDKIHKRKIAVRASVIAFGILLFFIVIGQIILKGMSISLDAFQISGGVILFLFALTMIFGDDKPEQDLMTDNHIYTLDQQVITTLLVLAVVILTCLMLRTANHLQRFIGIYGITLISKVMGLVLASYAVQSILTGIHSLFLKT